MAQPLPVAGANVQVNLTGLSRNDYRGAPSTLCQGCGHNSIASQIIAACYDMNIVPENVVKFSGIGCSSKSPTYFLGRSFGFNSLHGRMPSIATGALFADRTVKGISVSGDGDSANIGIGQFKHMMRRNANMLYIIENNGVYGLTKGQFSATADIGLTLKKQGTNEYTPIDICEEALIANASFVARSFAGNPKQVKELLKAALSHKGIAVIDIISPCVTFNNQDDHLHSYAWGKDHEQPLQEISYVPPREEIMLQADMQDGDIVEVALHDGSLIRLKAIDPGYDATSKLAALTMLEKAREENLLVTGLIYIDEKKPDMIAMHDLSDRPLNRMTESDLRPARETIAKINDLMF
ncbi:MAG: 2-oxoglutarate ferredoxin oxidoreductase subunit beta [Anaerolineae bacterium CG_4_9_14_3_um_filter_57_17]|nr:2-oxoacid:ferredoxin oxidoreductase subunit beta [bacterium]NCT21720.1 2-oxoacid:ferredoxin oxidoreductase subunit beta [bacterium]OIO84552.1 MAG: 2-oxoglutarate ferredoxin oxidoreductase subunit beta [Anaerolineae bacterium CG2_30_57_67]PJB65539.1 MAG: 2-oxoglutarate ferredoxin oxidoreductase subunit beta [Anaerolineae bacterium CG_4_9_14_3_um_filter_57_17]